MQIVRVHTARRFVVLAGDAVHYWMNIDQRNPFPAADALGALEGFRIVEELAEERDHVIAGRDPLALGRFPPLRGNLDIVRGDLPPNV